ncbi:MAG: hypothetical protein JWQ20_4581 [Conexibacter sp.]|nr:hypothetical protein [Conexibacter sp.]
MSKRRAERAVGPTPWSPGAHERRDDRHGLASGD